jgi:hypothetical protein
VLAKHLRPKQIRLGGRPGAKTDAGLSKLVYRPRVGWNRTFSVALSIVATTLAVACGPSAQGDGSCDDGDGRCDDPSPDAGLSDPPPGCASDAQEYIFVVDRDNKLYRFEPAADAHSFQLIGTLDCPAGDPIWSPDAFADATPFSMSVDRDAVAWVLYTSGEMFRVSTEDASCTPSGFQPSQADYDLFGMGFVADSPGSAGEKLFAAGFIVHRVNGMRYEHKLGYVDPMSLQLSHVTAMGTLLHGPELTGTGDARLYAYFPGGDDRIVELDKSTGSELAGRQWPAGQLPGEPLSYAFAHWGGRFYVFVTSEGSFGGNETQVIRVDPEANGGAGLAETVTQTGVPEVVGAGVSTCAPIVIE